MERWSWIAWYRSNTLRALLVALVAWTLDVSGVAEDASGGAADSVVDAVLGAAQGVALLWAMYARSRQPTPPLALTQRLADERNAVEGPLMNGTPHEAASHGGQDDGT